MGGHGQPPEPAGYSTRLTWDDQSGFHTDGYKKIIIDPDTLEGSINTFLGQLHGQDDRDLKKTLLQAILDSSAFGRIPNSDAAYTMLQKFVNDHADAISAMGVSLEQFVARVQAAAQLGYDTDPATKAAAARANHGHMLME